jgi:transcriptional regulator with XRE-family HTH domain
MNANPVESDVMQQFDVTKMKELREQIPLTQAEAAARAKMTVSRWCDIEKGGRRNVTMETLAIIAEALGCDARDLITAPVKKAGKRGKA